jgi:hypothetical protein
MHFFHLKPNLARWLEELVVDILALDLTEPNLENKEIRSKQYNFFILFEILLRMRKSNA